MLPEPRVEGVLSERDPAEGGEPGAGIGAGSDAVTEAGDAAAEAAGPGAPETDPGLAGASDAATVEACRQRARLAEDRLAEVLAAYRGLKKENDAHRERTSRNLERRYEGRRERLLLRFIDILDNLDRALEAAETTYTGEPLIEGLILVRTQLLQALREEGLERIPVLGLPYDPAGAEVVETRLVEDPEHNGVVVKELLRGYRLNGRIARPAKVAVGTFRPQAAGEAAAAPAAAPAPGRRPASAPAAGPAEPTLEEIIARAEAADAVTQTALGQPGECPGEGGEDGDAFPEERGDDD